MPTQDLHESEVQLVEDVLDAADERDVPRSSVEDMSVADVVRIPGADMGASFFSSLPRMVCGTGALQLFTQAGAPGLEAAGRYKSKQQRAKERRQRRQEREEMKRKKEAARYRPCVSLPCSPRAN